MKNSNVVGVDFGSGAVRVIIVNSYSGVIIGEASADYSSGLNGVLYDEKDTNIARQRPEDFLESLVRCFNQLKEKHPEELLKVTGIGVDATGSTPIPVMKNLRPVSEHFFFKNNLNAFAWMWKDHSANEEALLITKLANEIRPSYLKNYGGKYSSEWFWAKILHCFNVDKDVFNHAYTWVELSDFVPAVITGVTDAKKVKRNVCASGHKALYNPMWGGYPDLDFIVQLNPALSRIRDSLPETANSINDIAGYLSPEWAEELGMPFNIPVFMGILDAHAGAVGAGVDAKTLVKIIGTSSCDIGLLQGNDKDIEGISGAVRDSVIPGYTGIEAGQSAVGDLLRWFVVELLQKEESYHEELIDSAASLSAGQSGLLSLDWNNGNRNVLNDQLLSGLIIGQTLSTKDYEIYRALIEAIAFGAKKILERIETGNENIERIICCGGIPEKNPLFMQIYADVLNRDIYVSKEKETVAFGAALIASFNVQKQDNPNLTLFDLQKQFCSVGELVYRPDSKNVQVYNELYELYSLLHDSFGSLSTKNLYEVMKHLIQIKQREQFLKIN